MWIIEVAGFAGWTVAVFLAGAKYKTFSALKKAVKEKAEELK